MPPKASLVQNAQLQKPAVWARPNASACTHAAGAEAKHLIHHRAKYESQLAGIEEMSRFTFIGIIFVFDIHVIRIVVIE